jgi:hypothetical protein
VAELQRLADECLRVRGEHYADFRSFPVARGSVMVLHIRGSCPCAEALERTGLRFSCLTEWQLINGFGSGSTSSCPRKHIKRIDQLEDRGLSKECEGTREVITGMSVSGS